MRRIIAILAAVMAFVALVTGPLSAQRRVSPVKPPAGQNFNRQEGDSLSRDGVIQQTDSRGRKILVDTVSGTEVPDTAGMFTTVPKMIYPLFHSVSVGVDIWDPVMRIFGQHYGLVEFSGELNLHNRYIPVVEIGLGQSTYTPANQNYTYRVSTVPYFRIGCNYNFLYNSNPDYLAYGGIRVGFSPFNYHLENVTVNSGYWNESQTVTFPSLHSDVVYLNLLFGIRVKIIGPVSMGWSFRFKTRLHETKNPAGNPWYIPGYGTRNSSISGSFSIYYTLPLHKPTKQTPKTL